MSVRASPDQKTMAREMFVHQAAHANADPVEVPDVFSQAFVMEKDGKRFPKSGGWGCAVFNYDPASDKFTSDPSPADCGNTCHTAIKAKDYIFHPYQKR